MPDQRAKLGSVMTAGLAACALLPAVALSQETVNLTPRFEPGRVVYVEVTFDVKQSITGGAFGETGNKRSYHNVFGALQKVESASAEDGAQISLSFDRVAQRLDMPMATLSFDSDVDRQDADNLLGGIWNPVLGESVCMAVDTQGRVASFGGMGKVVEKVKKHIDNRKPCKQLFADSLSRYFEDDLQQVVWGEQRFVLYANKEVSVGDTWTNTYRQPGPDREAEYLVKLDRIAEQDGRKVAIVSYEATFRRPKDAKDTNLPGGARLMYARGSLAGMATFDIELGEFTTQQDQGKSKMYIIVPVPNREKPQTLTVVNAFERTYQVTSEAERAKNKPPADASQQSPDQVAP